MRDTYHDHLDAVVNDLFEMSRLVARAVAQATAGLVGADLTAVERVIADDEAVNALYRGVETQAYDLLARQQPVATDLQEPGQGTGAAGGTSRSPAAGPAAG